MYTLTKKFHELTVNELYDILQLRNQCFIVEQKVPYQDLDNFDKEMRNSKQKSIEFLCDKQPKASPGERRPKGAKRRVRI